MKIIESYIANAIGMPDLIPCKTVYYNFRLFEVCYMPILMQENVSIGLFLRLIYWGEYSQKCYYKKLIKNNRTLA